jgi:hypothetical protein
MTEQKGRKLDAAEIERAFRLLVGDGSITELRALDANTNGDRWPRTWFGYFDSGAALVSAVETIGQAKGVYLTLNPANPVLLARAANRIKPAGKGDATQDGDILKRRWLPIDCDPIRPAGISASDDEHSAALAKARDIAVYLRAAGWPQPILADSGNGAHVLYRIDLSTDDGGLVQRILQALAVRFDDEAVKVDKAVFNPARIWKLYGTTAAKGDDVPGRPWRLARIIDAPDCPVIVPTYRLEALAGKIPTASAKTTAANPASDRGHGERFDVARFIARHGLEIDGPHDWNGTGGAGLKWTFRHSPLCEHHGDGPFILQHASGAVSAGCHHDSCKWTWQNLRNRFEPRDTRPIDLAGVEFQATTSKVSATGSAAIGPATPNAAGVRDDDGGGDDNQGERKSQATLLAELATAAELWHTAGQCTSYATLPVADHAEHWPIRSKAFSRNWLARQFFLKYGKAPSGQALADALNVIEGQAFFEGREYPCFVRVAEHEGQLYFDLANEYWKVAVIDAAGWQVIDSAACPVRFRRAAAMLPLPTPTEGGHIGELRRFVNVTDDSWPLLLGWLVAAFRPSGPYPILMLLGEQGSAKSTTARVARALIDPNKAPLRSEPRDPRDLMIAAENGWIAAYDNLSFLPGWLSDSLCRLSTGGGFATRTLYADSEETIFDAMRPVILNGIEEPGTRSDLLDRCVILPLPRIPEAQRRTEAEHWRDFKQAHGRLLGAVLSAVSVAMRNLPDTRLERLPRMADFALLATAAESGLGLQPGEFMAAYTSNRDAANETALESSPVAKHILQVADAGEWTGTAGELLEHIAAMASDAEKRLKTWPKNARSLSGALKRLAPNLRAAGVEVEFGRGTDKQRRRLLRVFRSDGNFASVASACVRNTEKTRFLSDANAAVSDANAPVSDANAAAISPEIQGKTTDRTQTDGADAKKHTHSKRVQVTI